MLGYTVLFLSSCISEVFYNLENWVVNLCLAVQLNKDTENVEYSSLLLCYVALRSK